MTGTISSQSVAFGCVAESTPYFYDQVLRLIRSIRWFGGSLADADIFVCIVGEVDAARRADFAALGAQVRVVSAFNPLNRFCNKIRFLELPELERYETIVLLDCDTALVQDPAPYFAQPALQLKIADLPTVPSTVLARLCAHFGLSTPAPIYWTTCSQEPTIWYCNTGVMILPAAWIARILPAWRDFIVRLCTEPGVFDPPYNHCNQAAMTLVYTANPLPFAELPAAMNFTLNQTHRLPAPALLREDPVILHYHDRVDSEGLLLPAPYPLAQNRIQQLNERLRAIGRPRPAASIHSGVDKRPALGIPPSPDITLPAVEASKAVPQLYGQLCDEVGAPDRAAIARIEPMNAADISAPAAPDTRLAAALALLRAHQAELTALRSALTTSQIQLAILQPLLQARETEIANYARELDATRELLQAREAEIAGYAHYS